MTTKAMRRGTLPTFAMPPSGRFLNLGHMSMFEPQPDGTADLLFAGSDTRVSVDADDADVLADLFDQYGRETGQDRRSPSPPGATVPLALAHDIIARDDVDEYPRA